MPPFGNLYSMPVYVDTAIARQETIAFNAARIVMWSTCILAIYNRLVHPVIAEFAALAAVRGR